MSQELTSEKAWQELERELFAVLGMMTAKGQTRAIAFYIFSEHLYPQESSIIKITNFIGIECGNLPKYPINLIKYVNIVDI